MLYIRITYTVLARKTYIAASPHRSINRLLQTRSSKMAKKNGRRGHKLNRNAIVQQASQQTEDPLIECINCTHSVKTFGGGCEAVKSHSKVAHSKLKVFCPNCGNAFVNNNALIQHKNEAHN